MALSAFVLVIAFWSQLIIDLVRGLKRRRRTA